MRPNLRVGFPQLRVPCLGEPNPLLWSAVKQPIMGGPADTGATVLAPSPKRSRSTPLSSKSTAHAARWYEHR